MLPTVGLGIATMPQPTPPCGPIGKRRSSGPDGPGHVHA
jgi:hypothetical protein